MLSHHLLLGAMRCVEWKLCVLHDHLGVKNRSCKSCAAAHHPRRMIALGALQGAPVLW